MAPSPGQLIRKARRRHGLSQERLALRAATTQSAISRLERDQLSPTVETLASLLRLMGEQLALSADELDEGHDRTLLRQNLALTPSDRVGRAAEVTNFVLRNRGSAREDGSAHDA